MTNDFETPRGIILTEKLKQLLDHVQLVAVLREREACAKVCDNWPNGRDDVYEIGVAIRARVSP